MTPTPYNHPYIPLLDTPADHAISKMEFPAPESTPPKLSLLSLPSKAPKLPDGLTPPPKTVATVPFLWEEAPGKPRATSIATNDPAKSKTVRSLDLPPRLTPSRTPTVSPADNGSHAAVGIEIIPSPTTVLSGPYEGVYASKMLLGSPEKVVVDNGSSSKSKGKMRMPLRKLMRKDKSRVKFSSWRWDSFRDIDGGRVEGSVKFRSWRWDSFRDTGSRDEGGGGDGGGCLFDDPQKCFDTEKVTRKNSFTFADRATSGFLSNMYYSVKKAMPWRSRRNSHE